MIKPLFGFDVTNDKKSEVYYADLFVSKKTDERISKALEEKTESLEKSVNASYLHPALTIFMYIALAFGIMVVGPMLTVKGGISVAFKNAPVLCYSGIISLVVGAFIWIVAKVRKKKVLEEENANEKYDTLMSYAEASYQALGVPADAHNTDILMFRFKLSDGKMKLVTPGLSATPFYNHEFKVFKNEDQLCIADVGTLYAFPLSSMKAIRKINKNANLPTWNKETAFNRGEYKQYKLGSNNAGISSKPYYVLELEHGGESYGIYFPCFELPTFEALTGLTVTADEI
jgi:hypothetical protein